METLYRIKPIDKKSIYAVYDVYKELPNGDIKGFVVRELYRWGQGFIDEYDNIPYADSKFVIVDPRIGLGSELDDSISVDFEYDGEWTEEEKAELENYYFNGDPNDEYGRTGPAWLYDLSDWEVEDDYIEILAPFKVDKISVLDYNVVNEESVELKQRPSLDKQSSWPWK